MNLGYFGQGRVYQRELGLTCPDPMAGSLLYPRDLTTYSDAWMCDQRNATLVVLDLVVTSWRFRRLGLNEGCERIQREAIVQFFPDFWRFNVRGCPLSTLDKQLFIYFCNNTDTSLPATLVLPVRNDY